MKRAILTLAFIATAFNAISPAMGAIDAIEGKWKPVFECEFDKPDDLNKWNKQDQTGKNANNEQSAYVTDAFKVHDGCLYIHAEKRDAKYGGTMMHYTSGLLNTKGKLELKHGRFDIRFKVPKGKGFCPGFWLLPTTGKWPPEIDLFEVLGHDPKRVYFTNHWAPDHGGKHPKNELHFDAKPDFAEDFHEVIGVWSKDKLEYYVDGKKVASSTKGIPQDKMYLILNLAVGGDWPGKVDASTKFPNDLVVDYVRVYEVDTAAELKSKASVSKSSAAKAPTKAAQNK